MSVLDNPQYLNRARTYGLKIATDAPSRGTVIPQRDLVALINRALTPSAISQLRAMYFQKQSSETDIKEIVKARLISFNAHNDQRDKLRYRLMKGNIIDAVAETFLS